MSTNESTTLDNFAKFMMAMSEAMNSQNGEFNFNSSTSNPMEAMLQNRIKLTELNWTAWSKNMIRNLKGSEVLCLFKKLEEEEFRNAMDVERTEQQKAKDASVALNLIHAGLDETAIRYLKSISDVTKCWKLLKQRYQISESSRHAAMTTEIQREMKWKEGDRMLPKWLEIRNMVGQFTEFEKIIEDSDTTCIISRFIALLWINHHLMTSEAKWTDIISRIDSEILSIPKAQLRSQPKVNENQVPNQRRTDQIQQRPKIKCHFYEKIGHRESDCRGKKAWEPRRATANMSQLDKDKSSEE
ncbi:hypothetical protein CFIMG_006035RA [Ceratocystis fimbriata CBS 114723]|uniref:Uncharacterized protein n=1 Tax=Ceratocystis fimbriata CBS 114723 TaxID=1035309 RepID=A0A2C5WWB5_9PEZI|nr:hypothetical protein CFIMG_006035RA [Ceratocystis fimbriata CBS 114723]